MKKFFAIWALFFGVFALTAREVDPKDAVIVIPPHSSLMLRFAASELQKHLQLICGKKIAIKNAAPSGKYVFPTGR